MNAPPHPPDDRHAISISGLRKAFGEQVVLDGIDLTVEHGTVVALLGPNGAGKTTMIQVLTTLLPPDDGEVSVAGHDVVRDPDHVRHAIGVTGQFAAVDGLLTGAENLQLMSDLRHLPRATGRQRVAELIERFDLVEAAGKPTTTYSGGMRRRLDLAMTLLGDPQIIFLDEPTTGLDPRSRRAMWDVVKGLVEGGVTIFLTTQYLDEADALANRIAVLDRGRIVAEGTAPELKRLVSGGHILLTLHAPSDLDRAARVLDRAVADEAELTLQVPSDGSVAALRSVLRRLEDSHVDIADLSIHTPDLDDVFLALTSRGTSDDLHPTSQKAATS
jgi:ABC-2 type transport system ATP-binding protein